MSEYSFEDINDNTDSQSELEIKKLLSSQHAMDLEREKFIFGKYQIRLIYTQQQKWMNWFVKLSLYLLGLSIIALVVIILADLSDTAIATVFVSIVIEVIALFSIMVKYAFSSHTNEFVKGMYKHNHFSHNNAIGEMENNNY